MGQAPNKIIFTDNDFSEFKYRINDQVDILHTLISKPDFGHEPFMMGAELEMYLIDDDYRVSPRNLEILKALGDSQFQPELNKYNIELNLSPVSVKGKPFSFMHNEMQTKMNVLEECANSHGINVIPVGVLPTLKKEDFGKEYMTEQPRYQALGDQLSKLRGESFKINIQGEEPVDISINDVTIEGANTSHQVHLMVEHDKFAKVFNAAQLTLPFVTAVCANSGILLGNIAWDETRVALFKQSLDTRIMNDREWRQPSRVAFGLGWVRDNAWELFAQSVGLFPPIMPFLSDVNSKDVWNNGQGEIPDLKELCLHMGTTWPWNRPVYCNKGNGHVRIEFRALPAGPTVLDMTANAAFTIGIAMGLSESIDRLLPVIPFRFAEYNFYRAAKDGLDAKILWPCYDNHFLKEMPLIEVLENLFPLAAKGLEKLGVDQSDINLYLNVISKRIETKVTGARWKKNTLRHLEQSMPKDDANRKLVELYLQQSHRGEAVTEWQKVW